MSRKAFAAVGVPAIAAVMLLGAAPVANAGEQHHHHATQSAAGHHHAKKQHHGHAAGCNHTCTPAPTPPPGGWPCQQTHTCKPPKHPHCPPVHHHPKPPVVHPKPPVVTHPKPVVHHHPKPPTAHLEGHHRPPATATELAFTGSNTQTALAVAFGLIGLGGITYLGGRTPRKQTKATREALR